MHRWLFPSLYADLCNHAALLTLYRIYQFRRYIPTGSIEAVLWSEHTEACRDVEGVLLQGLRSGSLQTLCEPKWGLMFISSKVLTIRVRVASGIAGEVPL